MSTPYSFSPMVNNVMSYYGCLTQQFTAQQYARMLQALTNQASRAFLMDSNDPPAIKLPSGIAYAYRTDENNSNTQVTLKQLDLSLERDNTLIHSTSFSGSQTGIINVDAGSFLPNIYNNGKVIPKRDLNLNSGIDAVDVGIVHNHVLNVTPITSPFKKIAADLSNNGQLSTLDVIILQKISLGIYNNSSPNPYNTSWKYIPTYCFNSSSFVSQLNQDPYTAVWSNPNVQNELRGYLPSGNSGTYFDALNIPLNEPTVDQSNTWSFQAIKVGDLNFSASAFPFTQDPSPELRGEEYSISKTAHSCLEKGQTYEIELLGNSKEELMVYQLGAKFDPNLIEIVRYEESQIKGFNEDNINQLALKDGHLKVLWVDHVAGQKIKFNAKKGLFKLIIRPKQDICNLAEAIALDKKVLPTMFISERIENIPMELEWNVKKVNKLITVPPTQNLEEGAPINLYPNPTSDEITLEVKLDQALPIKVILMDASGRTMEFNQDGFKGVNKMQLNTKNTFSSGLISYRVIFNKQQHTGTFVKIE
jgi:hypothetical protein